MKKSYLLTLVFLSLLSACAFLGQYRIEIKNETGEKLTDLRIVVGGYESKLVTLDPGKSIVFYAKPKTEDGVHISYSENGKHSATEVGYFSPPIGSSCNLRIVADGVKGTCDS